MILSKTPFSQVQKKALNTMFSIALAYINPTSTATSLAIATALPSIVQAQEGPDEIMLKQIEKWTLEIKNKLKLDLSARFQPLFNDLKEGKRRALSNEVNRLGRSLSSEEVYNATQFFTDELKRLNAAYTNQVHETEKEVRRQLQEKIETHLSRLYTSQHLQKNKINIADIAEKIVRKIPVVKIGLTVEGIATMMFVTGATPQAKEDLWQIMGSLFIGDVGAGSMLK